MNQDYIKDIKDIRQIMQDRTRFLSLSGLSGVLAGVYALIGAVIAYNMIQGSDAIMEKEMHNLVSLPLVSHLTLLGLAIFTMAFGTAYYFTFRKAKKLKEKMWTGATYKVLRSFAIPFAAGSVFVILLIVNGMPTLIAPSCLVFYGMSLFSASHYTFRDIGSLGIMEMLVGLVALLFPGFGLFFWALGFGVLHIIYGIIMYMKYDKN